MRKNHEAVTISDWDELESAAFDPDVDLTCFLCTEIQDEMIKNRRNPGVEAALRHMESLGGNKLAQRMEEEATNSLHLDVDAMESLPDNWAAACDGDADAMASTLALLNSISQAPTPDARNHEALAAEHFDWKPRSKQEDEGVAKVVDEFLHNWEI